MRYDATLKDLLWQGAPALLRQLTGVAAREVLPCEFPDTRVRRPDFVAWLEDGRLFHLELQATATKDMSWRMLDYYTLISARHGHEPVTQCVLALSDRVAAAMPREIRHPDLTFGYPVWSVEALDAAPLLASDRADDAVLAILCRGPDIRRRTRAVLARLADLTPEQRRDAATRLLILSGLRRAETIVLEEVTAMGIQIDIHENAWLMDIFAQGAAEGETRGEARGEAKGRAALLIRLLTRRFGPLPDAVHARIMNADVARLDAWADATLDAESLDAVFAQTPPA